jgi:hypothetical protein
MNSSLAVCNPIYVTKVLFELFKEDHTGTMGKRDCNEYRQGHHEPVIMYMN